MAPARTRLRPSYQHRAFPLAARRAAITLLASDDGRDGSVMMRQDVDDLFERAEDARAHGARARAGPARVGSGGRGAVQLNGVASRPATALRFPMSWRWSYRARPLAKLCCSISREHYLNAIRGTSLAAHRAGRRQAMHRGTQDSDRDGGVGARVRANSGAGRRLRLTVDRLGFRRRQRRQQRLSTSTRAGRRRSASPPAEWALASSAAKSTSVTARASSATRRVRRQHRNQPDGQPDRRHPDRRTDAAPASVRT